MRALGGTHIERQFHFAQRALYIGGRNRLHYYIAFVANDIGCVRLAISNQGPQRTAALRVTEIGMRKDGTFGNSHNCYASDAT